MDKSPGYAKHPEHKIREIQLDQRVRVEAGGENIADSIDVIKVEEDGYPPRYYFPRNDVAMDKLERSDSTTHCPFKGDAHYFNVIVGGSQLKDAVWTYENPYEEHVALRNRLAFYSEKVPEIGIVIG